MSVRTGIAMNTILLAPHNDDEALWASYIIQQNKPVVYIVTDSYIQFERGDKITKEQRIEETKNAMEILGVDVKFLHTPDKSIDCHCLDGIKDLNPDIVYAPYPESGGNTHHNIVGEIAKDIWGDRVVFYSTYTKDRPYPQGESIKFSKEEYEHKIAALDCYKSQLGMSNKYYFDQMKWRDECIIPIK